MRSPSFGGFGTSSPPVLVPLVPGPWEAAKFTRLLCFWRKGDGGGGGGSGIEHEVEVEVEVRV